MADEVSHGICPSPKNTIRKYFPVSIASGLPCYSRSSRRPKEAALANRSDREACFWIILQTVRARAGEAQTEPLRIWQHI